ncbi:hypothetical protein [Metabacillus indicus]|uniref:hypothetical protein n=1 Tax=Metabacillus indicus TaxID=246786 RepID=UPI003CF60B6C
MTYQTNFSTEIHPECKSILTGRNALDGLDFLRSSQDKILYSILDLNAYYHVEKQNGESYSEWNSKLFEQGSISEVPKTMVDYLSTEVPAHFILNKISYNFFNSSHSFFDNYGHFLHATLFPNTSIPERLYFHNVTDMISKKSLYHDISKAIAKYTSKSVYSHIKDIDNTNKHRMLISPESSLWLNDGQQEITIPSFTKGNKAPHVEKTMEDILEDCHQLCVDFYNEVTNRVFDTIK